MENEYLKSLWIYLDLLIISLYYNYTVFSRGIDFFYLRLRTIKRQKAAQNGLFCYRLSGPMSGRSTWHYCHHGPSPPSHRSSCSPSSATSPGEGRILSLRLCSYRAVLSSLPWPLSMVWIFPSWASRQAWPQPPWIHRGYTDGVACWGPPSHTALPVEQLDK